MSQNIALAKLRELNESKKVAGTAKVNEAYIEPREVGGEERAQLSREAAARLGDDQNPESVFQAISDAFSGGSWELSSIGEIAYDFLYNKYEASAWEGRRESDFGALLFVLDEMGEYNQDNKAIYVARDTVEYKAEDVMNGIYESRKSRKVNEAEDSDYVYELIDLDDERVAAADLSGFLEDLLETDEGYRVAEEVAGTNPESVTWKMVWETTDDSELDLASADFENLDWVEHDVTTYDGEFTFGDVGTIDFKGKKSLIVSWDSSSQLVYTPSTSTSESKKSAKGSLKVTEDLEVTDQVYVVTDVETGEILSDVLATEEEADELAQQIADEQGVEVVTESLKRTPAKKAKPRKVNESKTKSRRRIALNLK